MKAAVALIVTLSLALKACTYPNERIISASNSDTSLDPDEDTDDLTEEPEGGLSKSEKTALRGAIDTLLPVTYEDALEPIIKKHCYECHSVKKKGDFDIGSQDKLKKALEKVKEKLKDKSMPPKFDTLPADTKADVALLEKYLEAWSEAPSSYAGTLKDVKDLNYEKLIGPLNEKLCATCHSGKENAKNPLSFEDKNHFEKNFDAGLTKIKDGKMPPELKKKQYERLQKVMEEWKKRKLP